MGRYRHFFVLLHTSTSSSCRVNMNKYFPGIGRIEYRPDAGPEETLVFRHYNAGETVHGRTMEEWMKFSVCYFNTFRYLGGDNHYGDRNMQRSWEDGSRSMDNYKRRMLACFELLQKLDVKYYSLNDLDIAPEGDNFDETNRNLEEMVTLAADLQRQTGIKPLYYSADLFSNPRYMNGSGSNPATAIRVSYNGSSSVTCPTWRSCTAWQQNTR